MNLDDFKQRLLAEPRSRDAEILEARRSSTEHMAVARDIDRFEDQLEAALRVPASDGLADRVLQRCFAEEGDSGSVRRMPVWLAVAAMLVLAVGLGGLWLNQSVQPNGLESAFVAHLSYPEPGALSSAVAVEHSAVQRAFQDFGASLEGDLGQVTYVSRCKIGDKLGVHLVVTLPGGEKTTAMFLPDEQLADVRRFSVDEVSASMFNASNGVVALFGHSGQDLSELERRFESRLGAQRLAQL